MRKRPVSIAILLLVLGFVLLYYTMQKQYMEFQNTCNQKMEEMRNTALLWESNGLLEDSFVSGTFCAESGTAQLYIEVSPVEKSEELQVVLTCQGKAFPLTRTGSRFMGELEVPADTVCRISQVTVTSGQAVQTASLGWVINTKDMIFPQVESTYYGKGKSVPAGEPATFSGTIECTVSWPGILREEIVDSLRGSTARRVIPIAFVSVIWRKGACSREGLRRRPRKRNLSPTLSISRWPAGWSSITRRWTFPNLAWSTSCAT